MIIYGKQASIYALKHHSEDVEKIYISKKEVLPSELLKRFGSRVKITQNRWLQSLTKGGNHQGIAIKMREFAQSTLSQMRDGDFLVVLDGLTDVGNIGSIVRSSYCLGVDGVIACGVNQLNFPAIVRSSSGALLDMPFLVKRNILDILNELKMDGFSLYGASMEGEPIENKIFKKRRVLVLGSEDRGISKRAKAKLSETVSIKMQRDFDSLNVSAAAAIIIHRMGYGIE
jgi:23S rRNA (guanosine2251-2'-O)-methyltransferase